MEDNNLYKEILKDSSRLFSISSDELSNFGNGRVLMHICCAPCAEFPVMLMRDEGYKIDALYYNPNIHPLAEWQKRLDNVKKYAEMKNLQVFIDESFMEDKWRKHPSNIKQQHCAMCYFMRMDFAAKFAAERNYSAFTTSLLVSPYQNHEKLHESARRAAKRYNVRYLECDFRDGFRLGQEMAREDGLYCQKYCGCIFSLGESRFEKKIRKEYNLSKDDVPKRLDMDRVSQHDVVNNKKD